MLQPDHAPTIIDELRRIARLLGEAGAVGSRFSYRPGGVCEHAPIDGLKLVDHFLTLDPAAIVRLAKALARVRREMGLRFYGEQPCEVCKFMHHLTDDGEKWDREDQQRFTE